MDTVERLKAVRLAPRRDGDARNRICVVGCRIANPHRDDHGTVPSKQLGFVNRHEPARIMVMTRVILVAAFGRNRVIGNGQDIPWRLRGEQQRFKQLTMGQTLVMGRKTYESIGLSLPGRTTVVITRQRGWTADGVVVVHSFEEALAVCRTDEVFIAGGEQVYRQALEIADQLELTEVHQEPAGDVFFPEVDPTVWRETARTPHEGYTFVSYDRKQPIR